MRLIKSKTSKNPGPYLSLFGFIGGIVSLIIGLTTRVDIIYLSGVFSTVLGGLVLCGFSSHTSKTFTFEVTHYKDIDMDNSHIVLIENTDMKIYMVSTFFTQQAYDHLKDNKPITLVYKYNYFSSTKSNPDLSFVAIGLEESITTIVKRNPKV